MTWNLFHGRDAPPDRSLFTWRSRLTRKPVSGRMFTQVNEDLYAYFAQLISGASWDVAFLQECPPRWTAQLARETNAKAAVALTSRNSWSSARAWVAKRNPDLIASGEGGSNVILVREAEAGSITITREVELRRDPERRALAFCETTSGLCLANIHLTNDQPLLAAEELRNAARLAHRWAAGRPLIFGGDFNLRPGEDVGHAVFQDLARDLHLRGATGPGYIDHLLANRQVIDGPRAWPDRARDVSHPAGLVRLSDHAPVQATFECSA